MQYKKKILRTSPEKGISNVLSKFRMDRWRFPRVMSSAS